MVVVWFDVRVVGLGVEASKVRAWWGLRARCWLVTAVRGGLWAWKLFLSFYYFRYLY